MCFKAKSMFILILSGLKLLKSKPKDFKKAFELY